MGIRRRIRFAATSVWLTNMPVCLIAALMLSVFCKPLQAAAESKLTVSAVPVAAEISLVHDQPGELDPALFDAIVDVRPLNACSHASLTDSRCIPVEDLFAPNGRLANWSGIRWALGSAGLSGTEHLLLVGEQPRRRLTMAGLLLLAGQQQISILEAPVSKYLAATVETAPGTARATVRTEVYTAAMRSELILLRDDVVRLINTDTVFLDGRTEAEFFASRIRAARGGHIPGAQHSAAADWQLQAHSYQHLQPVAYAHDAVEGLGYLSLLHSAGVAARLYLAGWVDWAADGALPADSLAYPVAAADRLATGLNPPVTGSEDSASSVVNNVDYRFIAGVAALATVVAGAAGYLGGRFSHDRKTAAAAQVDSQARSASGPEQA